jgi:hypothetical protein
MEMTPVWKERKSKSPFPLFPHCLGKLANTASLPHSHSFGDDLGFLFSTSSFNFNFDESVTDMPGTFCYRHARSLKTERKLGFSPCGHLPAEWPRSRTVGKMYRPAPTDGASCTKCFSDGNSEQYEGVFCHHENQHGATFIAI